MIYRRLVSCEETGDRYPKAEEQRLARAKQVIRDDEPEQSAARRFGGH
jgi:hypothetical protein